MNNTATTAMILPLALAAESFGSRRLLVGILLMTAYAPRSAASRRRSAPRPI
jgi:hypothetical protein